MEPDNSVCDLTLTFFHRGSKFICLLFWIEKSSTATRKFLSDQKIFLTLVIEFQKSENTNFNRDLRIIINLITKKHYLSIDR